MDSSVTSIVSVVYSSGPSVHISTLNKLFYQDSLGGSYDPALLQDLNKMLFTQKYIFIF